ncbi:unnamed protein product, partial [Ectocarpus sp. 12 AP-2014]
LPPACLTTTPTPHRTWALPMSSTSRTSRHPCDRPTAGMNHLLPGKKAPSEAITACYMGLLSQLAAKPEVLRVSP